MTTSIIYISSSWKNRAEVRRTARLLREAGFQPYDFTDAQCRRRFGAAKEIPPEKFKEQFDPAVHNYLEYLDKDEWLRAVTGNQNALNNCSGVILILPCGIDATADWAYAVGKDKLTVIVGHPPAGERSPVHLWADTFVATPEDAVEWFRKNLVSSKPKVSVAAIVLGHGGRAVLLGLRTGSHGEGTWSFPGGHLEYGEAIAACAVRETFEETGLLVEPTIALPTHWPTPTNDIFENEDLHYVTFYVPVIRREHGQPVVKEPHRCKEWRFFDWDDLPENLFLPVQNLRSRGWRP